MMTANENAPAALHRDEGSDSHLAAGVATTVPGRDVAAGDVVTLDDESRFTVARFDPYEGMVTAFCGPGRVAFDAEGESVVLFDDRRYFVSAGGL